MNKLCTILFIIALSCLSLPSVSRAAKTLDDLKEIQKSTTGRFQKSEISLGAEEREVFEEIKSRVMISPHGNELLRTAEHLGYQFGGFIHSRSVADSDPRLRLIHIGRKQGIEQATLSFAYELSNIINCREYLELQEQARFSKITEDNYVRSVIQLESQALYWQYLVAKDLRLLMVDMWNLYIDELDKGLMVDQKLAFIEEGIKKGYVHGSMPIESYYRLQYKYLSRR